MKSLLIILGIGTILATKPTFSQQNSPLPYIPEIVSAFPTVRDYALSPDGNTCFFTVGSLKHEFSTIVFMEKTKMGWSKPELAPFAGKYRDIEPAFSPDGSKLFFVSNRPKTDTTIQPGDYDIWYINLDNNNFSSEPINPGAPLNTDKDEFYPSITNTGDVYFTAQYDEQTKGKEDIYVCRFEKGIYLAPRSLPVEVNSETWEYNAFVAPDESYIIFSSYGRDDDMGGSDLYISFKNESNFWTDAQHLGPKINSKRIDYCPFVDTEGNLYFTSERSEVPLFYREKQTLDNLTQDFKSLPNGFSRLYVINISKLLKQQ